MSAGTIQGLTVGGTGIYGSQTSPPAAPPTTHEHGAQSVEAERAASVFTSERPVRRASQKPNRYGGKCGRCGLWVEAEQGVLTGRPGSWGVTHLDGACPETTPTLPGVTAPTVKAPAKPKRLRPNLYAGKCGLCGKRVYEKEGVLDKDDDDKWVVFHHEGECPTAFPFPEGRYAVESEEGELRFYHCADDGEVYVMASDNEHRLQRPAAEAVIAKIALDPKEAAGRYGQEFGTCGLCGRGLTDEVSRAIGIGPVCLQKAVW